ncbi:MAG: hypothetical protein A2V90_02060 [Gammaproteobacteria bacterium RBG_16_57_12]|nr:MAG: hypothetical protein A2V90_02060 [Gammaproteobacteria bacterium RBG_16_57_12]
MNRLISVMAVFWLSGSLAWAAHECTSCHLDQQSPGMQDLKHPVAQLCLDCHKDRHGAGDHPPAKQVTQTGKKRLPLLNGEMTCITCHDPHQKTANLLRLPENELCTTCHQQ